jgi:hypothetical protein
MIAAAREPGKPRHNDAASIRFRPNHNLASTLFRAFSRLQKVV